MSQLILTVTRACDLRCSYCPTAKDGWPSLSIDDALRGLDLFAERYGGGDVKLFGGEPLLVPEVVRAVMARAAELPAIRRVYLSTNGLGLDARWLADVADNPKAVLTISMDGAPEDHRRFRRALPGVADAYAHLMELMPQIRRCPRVVITQTVPPASAARAAENLAHLVALGLTRFNLLPGYYLPWRDEQLAALRQSFRAIESLIRDRWRQLQPFYLRNLFTRAPTPFFNTGLVIDADRTIHPSNVGLSGSLDGLRSKTCAGTLDDPPSPERLQRMAQEMPALLAANVPERAWTSTLAVDAELTRLCEALYPDYLVYRRRRRAA